MSGSPLPEPSRPPPAGLVRRALALLGFLGLSGVPLSAASGTSTATSLPAPGPGQTGFATMEAAAAGLRFTNRLTPEAIVRNPNFMNGSGVALGDVDGDGRCDLYFPAIDGTNRLYLNRGNWQFVEAPADAVVGLPGAHRTGAVL
ncbi:MAG: FG-GAP repeat domain-containing protein [Verrucomicrobiota bacterium]